MNSDDTIALGLFILVMAGIGYFSYQSAARKKRELQILNGKPGANALGPQPWPVVSVALIVASVVIALLTNLGSSTDAVLPFLIGDPDSESFQSIANGQVWRLFTPMFLHFTAMHLLFNMLWLWDLGAMMERIKGHVFLMVFVALVGVASNVTQYLLTHSPLFGGMSGVVYGLVGYIWIAGRSHPQSGFAVSRQNVVLMIGWFVLCWTGLLGPIANWAHTAGLAMGMAWAYIQAPERTAQ